MYVQWGYNQDAYTHSNIHFMMSNGNNFVLHNAKAHQKPDMDAIYKETFQISIPQYNYRILLHINYVQQTTLLKTKDESRPLINFIWKFGAGINIPRTDFTWRGDGLNNAFHIAGYNFAAEAGARIYPFKRLFFELTGKSGYVRYVNALVDTKEQKGNRVRQGFGYVEAIATIGYDINF